MAATIVLRISEAIFHKQRSSIHFWLEESTGAPWIGGKMAISSMRWEVPFAPCLKQTQWIIASSNRKRRWKAVRTHHVLQDDVKLVLDGSLRRFKWSRTCLKTFTYVRDIFKRVTLTRSMRLKKVEEQRDAHTSKSTQRQGGRKRQEAQQSRPMHRVITL